MGQTKGLNPPCADPVKTQNRRMRMVLPISIICKTCQTCIYEGTNLRFSRKDYLEEKYLGNHGLRFQFNCINCSAVLTIRTNPQLSDYVAETGADLYFDPWTKEEEATANKERERETEEMGDAMKSLENTALGSKQDMDILAAFEEMKPRKVCKIIPCEFCSIIDKMKAGHPGGGPSNTPQ